MQGRIARSGIYRSAPYFIYMSCFAASTSTASRSSFYLRLMFLPQCFSSLRSYYSSMLDLLIQYSVKKFGLSSAHMRISQVPEEVRILGQFPGKRANTMIANAMAIIHTTQGQRVSWVYKEFLLGYSSMQGLRTEHGCFMCEGHWENEVHGDETGEMDHTSALHCLLKPKTHFRVCDAYYCSI